MIEFSSGRLRPARLQFPLSKATAPCRRNTAAALTLACACFTTAVAAAAADPAASYPNRPVRLLMGPAAGGPTDGVGRIFGAKLSENWGQPVVIENRPGAGNTIATALAARATPDGYTLLLCPLSDAVAPALYAKLSYEFLRDIIGVAEIGTTANVFVAHPALPIKSVSEFIAYAKANPGKLNYGAQGIGQAGHLSMEMVKWMGGKLNVVYVPYKSSATLETDLMAARVQVQITNLPSHLQNIKTGKLRGLGVTTPKRDPRLPEVAAIAETLPGFDVTTWYGICAPAGMPKQTVSRINADVVRVLKTPDLQERLERYGVDAQPSTSEQFAALLKAETAKWREMVRKIELPRQNLSD